METPLVSVIITTRNEEDVIGRLLESIEKQSYKRVEVIVIDNNSVDKTKDIARKYKVKIFNKGPERSAQRNYGAKKAKGKYLLILDADMELTKHVVAVCVKVVGQDNKMAAAAILEDSIATNFWEKVKAYERSFYNLEGDKLTDAARFFVKNIFLKVGGYDESITGPEDWDLTERIRLKGYNVGIISSKILHYERIPSIIKLLKKKYYYGLKSHRYLDKQNIPVMSAKTVYFLRPVFYKNWKRLAKHPALTVGMVMMLTLETVFGAAGFLLGRFTNK